MHVSTANQNKDYLTTLYIIYKYCDPLVSSAHIMKPKKFQYTNKSGIE